MKKYRFLHGLIISLILSSVCFEASADWVIENDQSGLHFVSIKKNTVAETHEFTRFSGSLSDDGKLKVSIDLSSVSTRIDVRDQRMKEYLFQVEKFAFASIEGELDSALLKSLAVGRTKHVMQPLSLHLHGQKTNLSASLIVSRLSATKISVVTASPIIVNASDYLLVDGINTLKKLAGLDAIAEAVPVSFFVVLRK